MGAAPAQTTAEFVSCRSRDNRGGHALLPFHLFRRARAIVAVSAARSPAALAADGDCQKILRYYL